MFTRIVFFIFLLLEELTSHVQRVTIVYRNFEKVCKRKMKEKLKKNMKLKEYKSKFGIMKIFKTLHIILRFLK